MLIWEDLNSDKNVFPPFSQDYSVISTKINICKQKTKFF